MPVYISNGLHLFAYFAAVPFSIPCHFFYRFRDLASSSELLQFLIPVRLILHSYLSL